MYFPCIIINYIDELDLHEIVNFIEKICMQLFNFWNVSILLLLHRLSYVSVIVGINSTGVEVGVAIILVAEHGYLYM